MPEEKSFEKIPLQSNDGSIITVDYEVAIRSALLSTMLEDLKSMGVSDLGPVPLPNVRRHLACILSSGYTTVQTVPKLITCLSNRSTRPSFARLSSTASTTATTPLAPTKRRLRVVRRPPTSRSGIRSSCRSIRRCSSRSFWYVFLYNHSMFLLLYPYTNASSPRRQTTWTSRPCLTSAARPWPT
jgi:hypothetical protein